MQKWPTDDRAVNLMQIYTLFLHWKCLQIREKKTFGHRTFPNVILWFAQQHHWHQLEVKAINDFYVYTWSFLFHQRDSRSNCISNRLYVTLYQKFAAKILLAPKLHAWGASSCRRWISAMLRVLLRLSIMSFSMALQMSQFTYLFSFLTQYWLKCYHQ